MSKLLITSKNVEQHICNDTKTIYIDKTMILSPSAKDYLRDRGIVISYGARPEIKTEVPKKEVCSVDYTNDITMIATILVNEFDITCKEKIAYISEEVIKRIK